MWCYRSLPPRFSRHAQTAAQQGARSRRVAHGRGVMGCPNEILLFSCSLMRTYVGINHGTAGYFIRNMVLFEGSELNASSSNATIKGHNCSGLRTDFCLNSPFETCSPTTITLFQAPTMVPRSPNVHQAITYPRAAYKHCRSGAVVGRCGRHSVNTSTRHDHRHASRPQLSVTQTRTTNQHEEYVVMKNFTVDHTERPAVKTNAEHYQQIQLFYKINMDLPK